MVEILTHIDKVDFYKFLLFLDCVSAPIIDFFILEVERVKEVQRARKFFSSYRVSFKSFTFLNESLSHLNGEFLYTPLAGRGNDSRVHFILRLIPTARILRAVLRLSS